jgi:hypothetical protein
MALVWPPRPDQSGASGRRTVTPIPVRTSAKLSSSACAASTTSAGNGDPPLVRKMSCHSAGIVARIIRSDSFGIALPTAMPTIASSSGSHSE